MPIYDEKIMRELLSQPQVKKEVKKMNPATLKWYKELLISQGVYARYVKERGKA
jgi:hypothetical protein